MANNKHLTMSDRIDIEISLKAGKSFTQIANDLDKDPSTISKEVRNHIKCTDNARYSRCANYPTCTHHKDLCVNCSRLSYKSCRECGECYTHNCPDYAEIVCKRWEKPPYVCNGCPKRGRCKLSRRLYEAKYAQKEYEAKRSESRKGIATDYDELCRIDAIISPLIKQGQSIHQICVNNADAIMLDERTIYNYIDAGILSVTGMDLPRKARYRKRKTKKPIRIDKQCHLGRTYDDFLAFLSENPGLPVVEMDTVEGHRSGKVLLTLFFRNCDLMLAYIRDANTARSVAEIFDSIYSILGHETFQKLFPVILTDRGCEFSHPLTIECTEYGELRTRLFYCDPQRSDQKGGCEVTHEMIRRVIPKGTSFDHLLQEDIQLMMSHINSYTRKKLGDNSAIAVFNSFYGEGILGPLGIKEIPPNEIILTPKLLQR